MVTVPYYDENDASHPDGTDLIDKDTYVDSANATTDYSTSNAFTVYWDFAVRALFSYIKIHLPPNPINENIDVPIKLAQLRMRVKLVTDTAQILLHHSKTATDWNDSTTSWDNYDQAAGVPWNEGGEDTWDTSTDFGYYASGIIDYNVGFITGNWVYWDITNLLKVKDWSWDQEISLTLRAAIEDDDCDINFYSKDDSTPSDRPYVYIEYEDVSPESNVLSVLPYEKDITQPKFEWTELNKDDIDVQDLKIYRSINKTFTIYDTPISTNYGDVASPYPIINFKPNFENNPVFGIADSGYENELYYYQMMIEDNNNLFTDPATGGNYNAGKSNIVDTIRPKVGDFEICLSNGSENDVGTGINVQEEVVAVIYSYGSNLVKYDDTTPAAINTNFTSFSGIKKVNIDWGDGTHSKNIDINYDYLDNPCSSSTTIEVHDPTKFAVGDLIVIYDNTSAEYNARTVTTISATTITVDVATNTTFSVDDTIIYVANNLKHIYNYYQTNGFEAKCQTVNNQGFGSNWATVGTAPEPQPINPISKMKVTPKRGYSNELVDYIYSYDSSTATLTDYSNLSSSEYTTDLITFATDNIGDYILIGCDDIFNNYTVYISTSRTGGTLDAPEYWDGTNWIPFTMQPNPGANFLDTTSAFLAVAGSTYYAMWDVPSDWETYENLSLGIKKGYYIKYYVSVGVSTEPILRTFRKQTTFKATMMDSYPRLSNIELDRYAFSKDWPPTTTNLRSGEGIGQTVIEVTLGEGSIFSTNDCILITDDATPVNTDIRVLASAAADTLTTKNGLSIGGKIGNTYAIGADVFRIDKMTSANDGIVHTLPYWYFSYPDKSSSPYTVHGYCEHDDPTQSGNEQIGSLQSSEVVSVTTLETLKIHTYDESKSDLEDGAQVVNYSTPTRTIETSSLNKNFIAVFDETITSVTLTGTAYTDTDADGVPDDIVELATAKKERKRIQLTVPSYDGLMYFYGYITNMRRSVSAEGGLKHPWSVVIKLI